MPPAEAAEGAEWCTVWERENGECVSEGNGRIRAC
jgi:hypothetical protein